MKAASEEADIGMTLRTAAGLYFGATFFAVFTLEPFFRPVVGGAAPKCPR